MGGEGREGYVRGGRGGVGGGVGGGGRGDGEGIEGKRDDTTSLMDGCGTIGVSTCVLVGVISSFLGHWDFPVFCCCDQRSESQKGVGMMGENYNGGWGGVASCMKV